MKFKESISALKRDLLYRLQERMSNLVDSLKGGKSWGAESPRIQLFSCPGGQITGTLQVRRKNQKAFKTKCKMGSILTTEDLGKPQISTYLDLRLQAGLDPLEDFMVIISFSNVEFYLVK